MKKIGIIHSGMSTVEPLKKMIAENIEDVQVMNIIDDSLAGRVLKAGGTPEDVIDAVCAYAESAAAAGCDILYNPCALIRPGAEAAQEKLSIPYLCNDVPMTEEAIKIADRIGLITANHPAMVNVSAMVERKIAESGKNITLNKYECLDAFAALTKEKNREKYMELMTEAVKKACEENDVVLLGQGSMYAKDFPVSSTPVFDVHLSGIERIKEMLN